MSGVAEIDRSQVRLNHDGLLATWSLALRDPYVFLSNFVYTLDQHGRSIRKFPAHKPHLRYLTALWMANPLLAVKKSRQMVVTWWAVAMSLWDALHPAALWMLQSKREDDAVGDRTAGDGLLGRTMFILDHLPGREELCLEGRDWSFVKGNRVVFPKLNSVLWAVPQGGDIVRQRTATGILSDEAAFQPEFEDSYTGAIPCIRGGGRFVAVSTANPGYFEELTEDRVGLGED